MYDGKNGNPAYVAVNNVVYDVTNNRTWTGSNHFGLPAGREYTVDYNACHAGRPTLSLLPVVGRLIPQM